MLTNKVHRELGHTHPMIRAGEGWERAFTEQPLYTGMGERGQQGSPSGARGGSLDPASWPRGGGTIGVLFTAEMGALP